MLLFLLLFYYMLFLGYLSIVDIIAVVKFIIFAI